MSLFIHFDSMLSQGDPDPSSIPRVACAGTSVPSVADQLKAMIRKYGKSSSGELDSKAANGNGSEKRSL